MEIKAAMILKGIDFLAHTEEKDWKQEKLAIGRKLAVFRLPALNWKNFQKIAINTT